MRTLILLGFYIVASPLTAQTFDWVSVNEGLRTAYEPSVRALLRTTSGTVFAGTGDDGLYRSDDEGASWVSVATPFETHTVFALAEGRDNEMFVATTHGVFRAEPGAEWESMGLEEEQVVTIAVRGTTVFAGTWDNRNGSGLVYRWIDGGEGWEALSSFNLINAITIGLDGFLYLGTSQGLFRSANGVVWEEVNGAGTSSKVVFAPDAAYVAGRHSVYRSTDGGASWTLAGLQGERMGDLTITPDGYLLATVVYSYEEGTGVYGSEDGTTWTRLVEPDGTSVSGYELLSEAGAGTRTFVGTGSGVYRSSAGQIGGWMRANEGFERLPYVKAFAETGETVFAVASTLEYGEHEVYSLSEERVWVESESDGLPDDPYGLYMSDLESTADGSLLVALDTDVYRSEDGGSSWEPTGVEVGVQALTTTLAGAVLAGTYLGNPLGFTGEAYRSTDSGVNWTQVASLPGAVNDLAVGPEGMVYVGMYGSFEIGTGGVYRSNDDGTTWTQTSFFGPDVAALAVRDDGTVFAGMEPYGVTSGIFRSEDEGQTWEPTGYTAQSVTDLIIAPSGIVFAARARRDNFDGVYRSSDGGETWTLSVQGLAARYVNTLFFDRAGYLWAGTSHGAFRSANPIPVRSEEDTEVSPSLDLAPSYPNPAVALTRIPFSLDEAGPVLVTIHDVLGRRVATLVDAVLPVGEHEARWDARSAASGAYVVTLRAGSHLLTQRVTVTR